MDLPEKLYVAALDSIYGFGYKTVLMVINYFDTAKRAWNATEKELRDSGCPEKVVERLIFGRKKVNLEKMYDKILAQGINLVTIFDPEYPQELKYIQNPPAVLYVKGNLPGDSKINIAVVGTRTATVYGIKTARRISAQLARRNICVVSGMARGIDTSAHKGAIEAEGRTIAVLGCGIDVVYPPENRVLAKDIRQHGAVISEFPLGTPPDKGNFPVRNRIISGLSRGVVVVEAPLRSGALITADFALDQGREVFAVPGPVFSRSSEGCNQLIKDGAKLVQGVEDILEGIWDVSTVEMMGGGISTEFEKEKKRDPETEKILNLLAGGPAFLDELCSHSGISPAEMNIVITKLELEGLVSKSGGRIFALNTK